MSSVPEIRFKGYDDDWVQRKLGEVAEFSKGSGYSKQDLQKTGTPIILYGRLYTNYDTVIDEVDTFVDEKINSIKSSGNEIIVPASGETAEDIARASVVVSPDIILGGDLNIIKTHNGIDPVFLAITISNGQQQKEMSKRAQGKSVVHLYNSDLREVSLKYPLLSEQIAISNFFRTLDDAITLHKRKLDGLKELKYGYLQLMFPRASERVPKVRFEGFVGGWAERKLIQVGDYRNGKAHEQNIVTDDKNSLVIGKYIVVNSKFISTNGEVKKYTDEQIEPLLLGEIAFVLSDVPNGRAIARTFLVDENNRYSLNQRIAGISPHNETDSYFLYLLMNRNPYFLKFDDGVGQTNLSKGEVENFVSMYPCYDEQTAIGNFFRTLDVQITAQQNKVGQLQKIKTAYMKIMFV